MKIKFDPFQRNYQQWPSQVFLMTFDFWIRETCDLSAILVKFLSSLHEVTGGLHLLKILITEQLSIVGRNAFAQRVMSNIKQKFVRSYHRLSIIKCSMSETMLFQMFYI